MSEICCIFAALSHKNSAKYGNNSKTNDRSEEADFENWQSGPRHIGQGTAERENGQAEE